MTAKESKAVARLDGVGGVDRMFDSQWVNVVNHDNCYRGWDEEEAIAHAVKLTEQYMATNSKSALHAAEAELGELRRRVLELADSVDKRHGWFGVKEFTTELRQLLTSDGGADGDNEGEGK